MSETAHTLTKIEWTRDQDGDCHAAVGGFKFTIYKSSDHDTPFGLVARRISDEKEFQNHNGWGISWRRNKKSCVTSAEQILAAHGVA